MNASRKKQHPSIHGRGTVHDPPARPFIISGIRTISPWHRAVCGDLTSCFDFETPNEHPFPDLPDVRDSSAVIASIGNRPKPEPPTVPEPLFQEPGVRRSRALPYELHVHSRIAPKLQKLTLECQNSGSAGAVFHVYDKLHLDRIPRRYTVEAGKALTDDWLLEEDSGRYDLWVYAPNGFVREFRGVVHSGSGAPPEIQLIYDRADAAVTLRATNGSWQPAEIEVRANAYLDDGPWQLKVPVRSRISRTWSLTASHNWYDFTVSGEHFERRFAGRMETEKAASVIRRYEMSRLILCTLRHWDRAENLTRQLFFNERGAFDLQNAVP